MRRNATLHQGALAASAATASLLRSHLSIRSLAPTLMLASLLVFAAALRLIGIGAQALWDDEIHTAITVQQPWKTLLTEPIGNNQPLYFLLLKAWSILGGGSEAALRFPSAVFGVLTVAATYFLGRRLFNTGVGLGAALLVAIAPVMVWYSQEARAYSLQSFLLVMSLFFLVKYLDERRWQSFAGYVLIGTLGIYTHFYFGFFLAGNLVAAGAWLLAKGRIREVGWVLLAHVAIGASLMFRAPVILAYFHDLGDTGFSQSPLVVASGLTTYVGMAIPRLTNSANAAVVVVMWLLIGVSVAAALLSPTRRVLLPLLLCAVSTALLFAAGLLFGLPIVVRYQVPVMPLWFILAVQGLISVLSWRPLARPALAVPALSVAAVGITVWGMTAWNHMETTPTKEDWREMALVVGNQFEPTDTFVFDPPRYRRNFTYYFAQPAQTQSARTPDQWPCQDGQRTWLIGRRGESLYEKVVALGGACSLVVARDYDFNFAVLLFRPADFSTELLARQVDCKQRGSHSIAVRAALCGDSSRGGASPDPAEGLPGRVAGTLKALAGFRQ